MHNEDAFERLGRFYTDSATWGEVPRVRAMAVRVGVSFGRELGFEIGALILRRLAMNPMGVATPYRVVHSWGFEAFQGQASPGALAAAIERFRDNLAEGRCMCSERFLPWDRVPETVRPELGRMGITAVGSWMFRTNGLDGVILLGRSHDREEDDRVVSLAVLQVGTVATLLAARRVAESYARTDALTGLWNRMGVEDQIPTLMADARRHGERLVVTMIDVDDLKLVNDRDGHVAGDSAIQAVGRALRRSVRQSDVVGRWGGDEFVVVSGQQHPSVERVAHRIMDTVQRTAAGVSISAGSATWGEDGDTWEEVFRVADSRCYAEKNRHHLPSTP